MSQKPAPGVATRTQNKFLRAFYENPAGPPPSEWPSPVILRRWLKKPTFRQALTQLREANHHKAELQLSFAAAHAASALQQCFCDSDPFSIENRKSAIENALHVLRLHHIRLRFPLSQPSRNPAEPTNRYQSLWSPEEEKRLIEELDRARALGPDPLEHSCKNNHNVP